MKIRLQFFPSPKVLRERAPEEPLQTTRDVRCLLPSAAPANQQMKLLLENAASQQNGPRPAVRNPNGAKGTLPSPREG